VRRIAFLCGLCLLMIGAGASGAPLRSPSSTKSPLNSSRGLDPAGSATGKRTHRPRVAPVILLGHQAIEPTVDSNLAGTVEGFAFRARRAGTAASISVYLDARDRATTLFAGLYSSRYGHPQRLLTSGLLRSPRPGAWNSVAVGSARLRSKTTYWLAVLGKGGAIYFRDRNGRACADQRSSRLKLSALPLRWPAGPMSRGCMISAYVKGAAPTGSAAPGSGGGTKVFGINGPAGTSGTSNGTGAATPAPTAPAPPSSDPPLPPVATAAPTISGNPVVGQTLSTSPGSWIDDPTSYAYQWEDCDILGVVCTNLAGATSSSYLPATTDVGHAIRVVVAAINASGSGSATSAQTRTVTLPPAPSNNTAPVISGQAVQGQTLSTTNGSWTNGPTSYAYQWQDCDAQGQSCASIGGATLGAYTLVSADVGDTVRSVVTACNSGGCSAPAVSAVVGVVRRL
jgi:hypothetical protein